MVLVFDQMRAEYIDRFDLKNFQRARAMGVDFRNGIVGHLESNTIISHPVITTGKQPRNLPWSGHVMKDVAGLLGPKDEFYDPFRFTGEQYLDLTQRTAGDTSLIARVKESHPGPTLAVAQKRYAAWNFGGPYADTIVSVGSAYKEGPWKGYFQLEGRAVPASVSKPEGGRFYLEATEDYGSHDEITAYHGDAFVTGDDSTRPGGDVWVGDVVDVFMDENPDWSVILASFGSVDKVSHVLAEHDAPTSKAWALTHGLTLENALRKADRELGRILDRLQAEGWARETVLVITADHGGQASSQFHGTAAAGAHLDNLYIGLGHTEKIPAALKPLAETGLIEVASTNTLLSFWTRAMSVDQRTNFLSLLSKAPGVAEVWERVEEGGAYHYRRQWRSPELKGRELDWADRHNEELLRSFAAESGPQFVGLLFDRHGYDVAGSHGGAQELVQRIPYIVIAPNLPKGVTDDAWVRLVDVNPIVGRLMGLPAHPGLDGNSEALDELEEQ